MKITKLLQLGAVISFILIASVLNATTPNTTAPKGGTVVRNIGGEPPTIHPVSYTDLYATYVLSYTCDTLATRDAESFEWKPRLAEK